MQHQSNDSTATQVQKALQPSIQVTFTPAAPTKVTISLQVTFAVRNTHPCPHRSVQATALPHADPEITQTAQPTTARRSMGGTTFSPSARHSIAVPTSEEVLQAGEVEEEGGGRTRTRSAKGGAATRRRPCREGTACSVGPPKCGTRRRTPRRAGAPKTRRSYQGRACRERGTKGPE